MTARFGRNKRRAAREAIAKAEATAAGLAKDAQKERQRAWELKDQIDEIAERLVRAVGPETALLPLSMSSHFEGIGADVRRWPVKVNQRAGPMVADAYDPRGVLAVRHVDLLRLVAKVEADPVRYGVCIHFTDKNDAGVFPGHAICISKEAYRLHGIDRNAVRYLILQIARRFEEELSHA